MHARPLPVLARCLAAGLLAAALPAAASAAPTVRDSIPDRQLGAIVATGVPGVLAFVRDGGTTTVRTAGVDRLRGSGPLRPEQPFRVGSIAKSFVAAVTLDLVDERRLRLDDTVDRWLPGLLPRGGEITVEQLLRHTSGLADGEHLLDSLLRDPNHRFTPLEVARAAASTPLQFEPGRGWAYANANYVLLGLIVEKVTGRSLATELRERIVEPLRLRTTVLPADGSLPHDAARGYLPPANTVAPSSTYTDVSSTNPSWTWAAGAIVSSAADVSRFYRALLAGRLVPTRLLTLMTSPRPAGGGAIGYGLGLLTIETPCGRAIGHDGEIFGYTSLALARPDGSRSVVLLANASHGGGGRSILATFVELASEALCGADRRDR